MKALPASTSLAGFHDIRLEAIAQVSYREVGSAEGTLVIVTQKKH